MPHPPSAFALSMLRSSLPVAAQPQPSSCNILQGSGGSLCPSPVWVELRAGGTFWQVLSGVTSKEFPVAPLVRAEETHFLAPFCSSQMLINCLNFALNAASQKQTNELFGESCPPVSPGSSRLVWGEGLVPCTRVCLVNVSGMDFCLQGPVFREQRVMC